MVARLVPVPSQSIDLALTMVFLALQRCGRKKYRAKNSNDKLGSQDVAAGFSKRAVFRFDK